MKTRLIAIAFLAFLVGATSAGAQTYQTPGLGVVWDLDQLVASSAGAVTGSDGDYAVNWSVVVSPTDRLEIGAGQTLTFADDSTVGLEIAGALLATGTEIAPIVFTGLVAEPGSWRGIDVVDEAEACVIEHAVIGYADEAVDVFGTDVELRHVEIHDALAKAIDITAADGLISHCWLHHNQQRTISLTLTASPTIENSRFEFNNLENSSPYPYINIGLQGVNSPTIQDNVILGSGNFMSGGIAIWNASDALITGNRIEGCGYGILCYQTGANPTIVGNSIVANTINPDTVNWGFGIACNGNNAPIVAENTIIDHWYGVAAINGGRPNLGDLVNDFPGDDGGNVFHGNGLGGEIYAFYNNTPLTQMAQGNAWELPGEDGAEASIYHQVDDPSLGLVDFAFWLDVTDADRPPQTAITEARAFPNPFNPQVTIGFTLTRADHVALTIHDVRGRVVNRILGEHRPAGPNRTTWDGTDRRGRAMPSGTYHYRLVAGGETRTGKLVLVR